jgi:hypothetical protein
MVGSLAVQASARVKSVKARIPDVPDRGYIARYLQCNNRRSHRRQLRQIIGHLENRSVCALERDLHNLFCVSIWRLVVKSFRKYFDRHLRSYVACLCPADAVGNGKQTDITLFEVRILVVRPFFTKSAIRNGRCRKAKTGLSLHS